jgi:uncharacterized RDD family membrane protein YckC
VKTEFQDRTYISLYFLNIFWDNIIPVFPSLSKTLNLYFDFKIIKYYNIQFLSVEDPHMDEMNFASLKERIIAALLDFVLFLVIFFPITYLIKGVWVMSPIDHQWAYGLFITDPICIAFLVIMIFYFIALEARFGQTLGKLIMGIKIIDKEGNSPGFRKSLIRNLLRVVDALPSLYILGIYLISTSEKNQRYGDKKANVIVVKKTS